MGVSKVSMSSSRIPPINAICAIESGVSPSMMESGRGRVVVKGSMPGTSVRITRVCEHS